MKQTLAQELREVGYELFNHYRDPRAGGTRHKIVVGIPGAAYTDRKLDPDEVSEIVRKYVPEAEVLGITGTYTASFVWLAPLRAKPKSIGTDYYTRKHRAGMTLRKMGVEPKT